MPIHQSYISEYLVTFSTLALVPHTINGRLYTRVIENHAEFVVHQKPLTIIKKSLAFYGTTLSQSILYSRQIVGNLNKVPIILSHDFGSPLILFPTLSPESEHNIWIAFGAIDHYDQTVKGQCTVHFKRDKKLEVPSSFNTMCRQFFLCHYLTNHYMKMRETLNPPTTNSHMIYLPQRTMHEQ
ncbi:competence protein ComK [Paenisporosarcina cavernae]|uniref:Competence protein ComK n=1 Tax=Paenisporosarcina cavernae TaxID=2320858 RepID=A0A385YW53_9BACL|nr:competence protein ComK [Paenisporosarcina cavernae]AYC30127.1 hypothetical protein D3873_09670 [Paenisporosarcina cavernae]